MKKKVVLLTTLLIFTFSLVGCGTGTEDGSNDSLSLYETAVLDAMVAEEEEILPLVTLTEDDSMTTWNDEGKVLLLTWHSYPDSYIDGESTVLEFGDIWTFTDKEISSWYEENKNGVEDWEVRLEQLIGLPAEDEKTHFTALWVELEDVVRPAYETDVTKDEMQISHPENMEETYRGWFDENIVSSYYYEETYPWTRLGYTYDWADNGTEYGLSEFLVEKGSTVDVEFTKTTEEFLDYLEETNN